METLSSQNIGPLNSKQCFLVFEGTDDETVGLQTRAIVDGLSSQFPQFTYYYCKGAIAGRVKDAIGLVEDGAAVAVVEVKTQEFFFYDGKLEEEGLLNFLKSVADGTASPHLRTAERPPNDRDPEHPEVYTLTALSFPELVEEGENEFLVDLWADWCGPCIAVGPTLNLVAEVFADIPTINVGKLNVDDNATPRKYFPETHIPNMKFFSMKDKSTPIPYNGNRTLPDFIQFIHDNAKTDFDLEKYKEKAAHLKSLAPVRSDAKDLYDKSILQSTRHKEVLGEKLGDFNAALEALKTELEKGSASTVATITALVTSVRNNSEVWDLLKVEEKKWRAEEEKRKLKKVIQIESDADYDGHIASSKAAGQVTIVDCFATWCGPCVMISPVFADLSEEFTSLKFLKIDVDRQKKTSQSLGIRAMPTFKVVKDGEVVDELVGANPDKLKELCKKYSVAV